MKKKSIQLIFVSVCMLLLQTLASAQGALEGDIKDKSGESLSFSIVRLKENNTGAIANDAGHYKIDKLAAGSYTVVFTSVGYDALELQATIVDGKTTKLNAELASSTTLNESKICVGIKCFNQHNNSSRHLKRITKKHS
jgi:hypothetical protein